MLVFCSYPDKFTRRKEKKLDPEKNHEFITDPKKVYNNLSKWIYEEENIKSKQIFNFHEKEEINLEKKLGKKINPFSFHYYEYTLWP